MFRPFVGVAPLSYLPVFEKVGSRKQSDGHAIEFEPAAARPKLVSGGDTSYLEREDLTLLALAQSLERKRMRSIAGREVPPPSLE